MPQLFSGGNLDLNRSATPKQGVAMCSRFSPRFRSFSGSSFEPIPSQLFFSQSAGGKPDFVVLEEQSLAKIGNTSADALIYPWVATTAIVSTIASFGIFLLALSRKPLQHNETDLQGLLPDDPKISDKHVIIAEGATHWRAAEAKPMACDFDTDLAGFDWAAK
ncbi:hypothetical protein [Rhizobium mongolense]|uniref:Uncharacterized protein n=1 Tax=Rhizobium mongolense TaxID=57676 RepID=A0A7W6RLM5_9HYPH|nr:hypothetical protein [Rhizobium mongolense]MBB4274186.1 hypothetical protein [Rhizobium mongolense]